MKNDSYSRYIRSDMYKEFLQGSKKKVVIGFTCYSSRVIIQVNSMAPAFYSVVTVIKLTYGNYMPRPIYKL